jgi:hypothetical protein
MLAYILDENSKAEYESSEAVFLLSRKRTHFCKKGVLIEEWSAILRAGQAPKKKLEYCWYAIYDYF